MCSTHQGNYGSNFPLQCAWRQLSSTFTFLSVQKGPTQSYHLKVAKISSIFGPSEGILPFLGWLPGRGFSRLAPTAPLGTLHEEGSEQRQGTDTAWKPTRPSGISSALERECLTGVAGGSADQATQGTSRGFTAWVCGRTSLPRHRASTLGDRQKKPGTCLADLCCPVSALPVLDFFQGCRIQFSVQSSFPEGTCCREYSTVEAHGLTH